MKEFIEVHCIADNSAVLVPVRKITAILDCGDGTFIETGFDGRGKSTGVSTVESYGEVKQKIQNLEV